MVAVLGRRNAGTVLVVELATAGVLVVTVDAVGCFTADTGGGGNAVLGLLICIDFNINNSNL